MDELSLQIAQLELQKSVFKLTVAQSIFSLLLLIVTTISVLCAFRAYNHQKLRAKKDAACSLANFYANDILNRIQFISYVIKKSGHAEKIKNAFPYDQISKFNTEEAASLIDGGEDALDKIFGDMKNIDTKVIYEGKILLANTIEERHTLAKEYIVVTKSETGDVLKTTIAHGDFLRAEFECSITELLNNLEWFAMNFHYNLADEEILYQSLHQTFLSNVWLMYLYICRSNRKGADKYYTNIIWLFNLWKERLRKIEEEALKLKSEQENELKRLELERNNANKRYEDAKKRKDPDELPVYTGKPL